MTTLRQAAAQLIENCPCKGAGCEVCTPFKMALGIVESTCDWCSGVGTLSGKPCAFCGGKGVFKQDPGQMALFIRLWSWGKWEDENDIECQVTVMCENFGDQLKLKDERIGQRDLMLAMLKQAIKLIERGSLISQPRVQ